MWSSLRDIVGEVLAASTPLLICQSYCLHRHHHSLQLTDLNCRIGGNILKPRDLYLLTLITEVPIALRLRDLPDRPANIL